MPKLISRTKAFQTISELFSNTESFSKALGEIEIPQIVSDWVRQVQILKKIPFRYLVASPNMLPIESIRFFQLDWNWIISLIDGAFSIGRSTTGDITHDSLTLKATIKLSGISSLQPVSGFLLRSGVVSGWPGLQVEGYDDSQNELNLVRMDHLSPNVLICLFQGLVSSVEIHEPPEGIHFGVDPPTEANPNFSKSLKYVSGNSAGNSIPDQYSINSIPFRSGDKQVLSVQNLAIQIQNQLISAGALTKQDPFTSAEFGLEMVEGVQQVSFNQSAGITESPNA